MLHETHCLSRQIEALVRPRKKSVRGAALPAVQPFTIVRMFAAGQRISLLPTMALSREQGRGCVFVSLGNSAPEREINLLQNPARYRSKAAVNFASRAEEVLKTTLAAVKPKR
jgi:DNA-binding transcriptional LysR family regulator